MNSQPKDDKFAKMRQQMAKRDLIGRGITNPDVLAVMQDIPREEFVLEKYCQAAYNDGPLPIGMGQTISQPFIVALMTQDLKPNRQCNILEIGTGSGYQTAILSKLCKKVYTIERYEQLSAMAQAALGRLDISNVEFFIGDGSGGWPKPMLFDRIIITAAAPKIAEPLLNQLAEGGLIVAPIGGDFAQSLVVYEKKDAGIDEKAICDVRFVKLIGQYGFEE